MLPGLLATFSLLSHRSIWSNARSTVSMLITRPLLLVILPLEPQFLVIVSVLCRQASRSSWTTYARLEDKYLVYAEHGV